MEVVPPDGAFQRLEDRRGVVIRALDVDRFAVAPEANGAGTRPPTQVIRCRVEVRMGLEAEASRKLGGAEHKVLYQLQRPAPALLAGDQHGHNPTRAGLGRLPVRPLRPRGNDEPVLPSGAHPAPDERAVSHRGSVFRCDRPDERNNPRPRVVRCPGYLLRRAPLRRRQRVRRGVVLREHRGWPRCGAHTEQAAFMWALVFEFLWEKLG